MVKISKKQIVSRLGLFAGAALAGVILTGCAEEVNQWWGGGQPKVEVTASVRTADPQAATRADDGLNIASTGFSDNTQKVYIGVNKGSAGEDTWTGYEFGINGSGASQTLTAPSPGPAFPSGVNSVLVYGWYPYNSGSKTFTVSAAQNDNANYNASDLMLANSAACTHNGTTVTPASLTFRHALTKMKVTVNPQSGVTINSITLKSMKKSVTINDDDKAELTVGEASSEGDITLYSGTSTTAITQCAVFPAQSKSAGALLVVNATAGGGSAHDVTYSLSASKEFTADKEYQMNISLGPTDVRTQTITLENWSTAAGIVNVGDGALAFDRSTLDLTYGAGNGTLQITGSVTIGSGGTGSFTVTSSSISVATVSTTGTTVTVTPVSAGSTTITVTDANKPGNTATCTVNVAKGTPTVTAPTYVGSTLTYNSSAQTLINAGTAPTGTTMKYATGTSSAATGTWSTDLPTGTNAGTYYVWYKVEGGSNYNDVAAAMISGSKAIGKATPTLTLSTSSLTFTALNSEKTFTITYDGDGTLSATSSNSSYATASLSSKTVTVTSKGWGDATITVSAAAGTNYNAAASQAVSVEVISDPGVALASASVGMIVGSNGKAYNVSDKDNMPSGVSAVAVVGYKNGTSGYALALVDASDQTWNEITNNGTNKNVNCTLSESKRGSVPAAPTGTTWMVLNKANYEAVFVAMGSTAGDNDGKTYDTNVNSKITAAGGSGLSGGYWSSQEDNDNRGWYFNGSYWSYDGGLDLSTHVRPALAW